MEVQYSQTKVMEVYTHSNYHCSPCCLASVAWVDRLDMYLNTSLRLDLDLAHVPHSHSGISFRFAGHIGALHMGH